MELYIMSSFLSGSFGFTLCLQDSSMSLYTVVVHFILFAVFISIQTEVYPFVVVGHLLFFFFNLLICILFSIVVQCFIASHFIYSSSSVLLPTSK